MTLQETGMGGKPFSKVGRYVRKGKLIKTYSLSKFWLSEEVVREINYLLGLNKCRILPQ